MSAVKSFIGLSFRFRGFLEDAGETGRAVEPRGSPKILFVSGGLPFRETRKRKNLWIDASGAPGQNEASKCFEKTGKRKETWTTGDRSGEANGLPLLSTKRISWRGTSNRNQSGGPPVLRHPKMLMSARCAGAKIFLR
jgi:hypothetical protein